MIKCNNSCTPCCDFCIHVIHEVFTDDVTGEEITGSPIACKLHNDEEHNTLCESCSYCDDFHCFRAKEGK